MRRGSCSPSTIKAKVRRCAERHPPYTPPGRAERCAWLEVRVREPLLSAPMARAARQHAPYTTLTRWQCLGRREGGETKPDNVLVLLHCPGAEGEAQPTHHAIYPGKHRLASNDDLLLSQVFSLLCHEQPLVAGTGQHEAPAGDAGHEPTMDERLGLKPAEPNLLRRRRQATLFHVAKYPT